MPLLATPVVNPAGQVDVSVREDRRLDFWSVDGSDQLQWDGTGTRDGGSGEYIAQGGITGLEIGPRVIVADDVQGLPGQRLREIKQGPRTVVLPVFVISNDLSTVTHLAQLARIRGFMAYHRLDYVTAEGTFDLVATAKDRFGADRQRFLRCLYVSGAEGDLGWSQGAGGPYFTQYPLQLLAVQPYWRGSPWTTGIVTVAASAPFLTDVAGAVFPRQLSPSVALGQNMTVRVGGDAPSAVVVDITGPAGIGTAITSPQGLNITLTQALPAGQDLHIDTGSVLSGRRKQVTVDAHGGSGPVAAWQMVGGSPVWQPLPAGDSLISVVVTGATPATSAEVHGVSMWETPW